MDKVITENTSEISNESVSSVVDDASTSAKGTFTNMTSNMDSSKILKIIAVVLILAFLGFNLFTYLGEATDITTSILDPLFRTVSSWFGTTVKKTVHVGAEGTKLGADVAAGTVTSGVDLLDGSINNKKNVHEKYNEEDDENNVKMAKDVRVKGVKKEETNNIENAPLPDDAGSRTQTSTGESGYCYIGEDRGFRSCVEVSKDDVCMSGDIFPTREVCINPNLRQ